MTAPGWYNAQGDPPGTTRYWDGETWIGDPVYTPQGPAGGPGAHAGTGGPGQLASPGSRIGARLIDFIIFVIMSVVLFIGVIRDIVNGIDDLGPFATDSQVQAVVENSIEGASTTFVLLAVLTFLWDWLWVAFAGGTPGKLMLGLRVADVNTSTVPPAIAKAAMRALNRAIGLLGAVSVAASNAVGGIGMLIGLISLIMLFANSNHRTVMDFIGGTIVIKKQQ